MFSLRLVQNIILGFAFALLIALVMLAVRSGANSGKTVVIKKIVPTVQQGLEYFYRDQNRYPTTQEFGDRNLMSQYFSPFPLVQIKSKGCEESYAYRSSDLNVYTLHFCLPKLGWNQVTKQH